MTINRDILFKGLNDARKSWPVLMQSQGFRDRFEEARSNNRFTPDLLELYQRKGHLLFVYGSLKSPFPRNYILKSQKAEFVAVGLSYNRYCMYYQPKRTDERFPILLPPDPLHSDPNAGEVVGQVWIVYPETIAELDRMEKNGSLYHRFHMSVQFISKPMRNEFQQYTVEKCWAYLGASIWKDLIPSQELVPVSKSKLFSNTDRERFLNWSPKLAQLEIQQSNQ